MFLDNFRFTEWKLWSLSWGVMDHQDNLSQNEDPEGLSKWEITQLAPPLIKLSRQVWVRNKVLLARQRRAMYLHARQNMTNVSISYHLWIDWKTCSAILIGTIAAENLPSDGLARNTDFCFCVSLGDGH